MTTGNAAIDFFLSILSTQAGTRGDVSKVLKAFSGMRSTQRSSVASELLRAVTGGQRSTSRLGPIAKQMGGPEAGSALLKLFGARKLPSMTGRQLLQALGAQVGGSGSAQTQSQQASGTAAPTPTARNPVITKAGGKRPGAIKTKHGGVRGAIHIDPASSSNVYGYGYDPQTGTLAVQYNAWVPGQKGVSHKPGAVYYYYDVEPRVFKALEQASSKGGFVWDRLRIRGTISGHQYDYRLIFGVQASIGSRKTQASKSGVYIPRLAKGQEFVKRNRIVMGKRVSSALPVATHGRGGTGPAFYRGR